MIDIHSHFLPGIDDGPKTPDMSYAILREYYKQGVSSVIATPHYYSEKQDVASFLNDRKNSLNLLNDYLHSIGATDIPNIYLGAEVALTSDLASLYNFKQLCISNTNYMLLEMPYVFWGNWIYDYIYGLMAKFDIIPILAHIDRYINSTKQIQKFACFKGMNIKMQINTSSVLSFFKQRIIHELIEKDYADFIATDCHNTSTRPVNMSQACSKLESRYNSDIIDLFNDNSINILNSNNKE